MCTSGAKGSCIVHTVYYTVSDGYTAPSHHGNPMYASRQWYLNKMNPLAPPPEPFMEAKRVPANDVMHGTVSQDERTHHPCSPYSRRHPNDIDHSDDPDKKSYVMRDMSGNALPAGTR